MYRFYIAGIEVQCDTLEELLEAVGTGISDSQHSRPRQPETAPEGEARTDSLSKQPKKRAKGPQGKGPKRAWAEAREYAEKHNITPMEARAILARKRKQAVQRALHKLDED